MQAERASLPFLAICWLALAATLTPRPALAGKPEGLSPQTIRLPSGPASLKGLGESFAPNPADGTGSFAVPIAVPPAHLAPEVKLVYSAGKGQGEAGMGFRLPLLTIYRTKDKGLPAFGEDDRFAVSGPGVNEELVLVDPASHRYRQKNEESPILFERDPAADSWTVRFPDGETAFAGEDPQSRQSNARGTYRWFITRQADRFGHEVQYRYLEDQHHLYLQEIRYQLDAAAAHQNSVQFFYEARPDVTTDYAYGRAETMALRLASIEVFHGPRRMRRVALTYEDGLLSSLLSRIDLEGEGGLSMPPLSFEYLRHTNASGRFVSMAYAPPLEGLLNGQAVLEDVNSDGLPDLLIGQANQYRYYENIDGKHWADQPTVLSPSPDVGLNEPDVLLVDIDGDGFRDVVDAHDGAFRYYPGGAVHNGALTGYGLPVPLAVDAVPDYHFGSAFVKLIDLDHDGRVDLLRQTPGGLNRIMNRADDTLQTEVLPALPPDVDFSDPRVELMDFNGDGALDFVLKNIQPGAGRVRVWYGAGDGVFEPEQEMTNVPRGLGSEFHLQDVNNDSQTDLVRVSGSWATYYLNDGTGRFTPPRGDFYGLPEVSATRKILFGDMNGNGSTDLIWLTLDGQLHYLDLLGQPNAGLLSRIDNGIGMVTTIDYRSSTEYAIEAKQRGEPWQTTLPAPVPVIASVQTTDSFDKLGLDPTVSLTTYDYADGYYDGREKEFRGFGRVTVTEWGDDQLETLVTEFNFLLGRDFESGLDQEALKGKEHLEVQRDGYGDVLTTTQTDWELDWMCQEDLSGVAQPLLPSCQQISDFSSQKDRLVAQARSTKTLVGHWEKTSSPKFVLTLTTYNEWGQTTVAEKWGEVEMPLGYQPGSPYEIQQVVDAGTDRLVEESSFINDDSSWIIGVPFENRVLDGQGATLAWHRTYYDGDDFIGLPLGQLTEGLTTRKESWLDTEARWVSTDRFSHDSHGNVSGAKDADGRVRRFEADPDLGLQMVREWLVVDGRTLEFNAQYDYGLGVVTSATDPNGNTSQYIYDGLGRIEAIVDPAGSPELPLKRFEYAFGTPDYPISTTIIQQLVDRQSATYQEQTVFSDGLGRSRETKTEAEPSYGYIASGWSELSTRGFPKRAYRAFPSSFNGIEEPSESVAYSWRTYDALGRALEDHPPAGDQPSGYSKTVYLPLEVRAYDERDTLEGTLLYPSVIHLDGHGRKVRWDRYNEMQGASQLLSWTFSWSPLGNLESVTDAYGNTRLIFHDSLGRLIRVEDPDAGVLENTYDDSGNLIRQADSLMQEKTWSYDEAGRQTEWRWTNNAYGLSDSSIIYHYDTPSPELPSATNVAGKLAWVEWPTGSMHFSYDELNRVTREMRRLWDPALSPGDESVQRAFELTTVYAPNGDVLERELPGGFEVDYSYNPRRLVDSITAQYQGETIPLVLGVGYTPEGMEAETRLGNGTATCKWYDERNRLSALKAGSKQVTACGAPADFDPTAFMHLVYHYAPADRIGSIDDLRPGVGGMPDQSASYQYDRIGQLIEANSQLGTVGYTYDAIHNLVQQRITNSEGTSTIARGYGELDLGPHQVTSIGQQTFSYDPVGNLEHLNGYQLAYDNAARLVDATKTGEEAVEYRYDYSGERRIAFLDRPGQDRTVSLFPFAGYEARGGRDEWSVDFDSTIVRVDVEAPIEPDLAFLDRLVCAQSTEHACMKPAPEPLLDSDGDGLVGPEDTLGAFEAYWNGAPLGQERLVVKYEHKDHLQGVTHISDSAGDLIAFNAYSPYGEATTSEGPPARIGFAGSDPEFARGVGLVRMGNRYYSPFLARWIGADWRMLTLAEEDQFGTDFLTLYAYSNNNPINFRDPSGNGGCMPGSLTCTEWPKEWVRAMERTRDLRERARLLAVSRWRPSQKQVSNLRAHLTAYVNLRNQLGNVTANYKGLLAAARLTAKLSAVLENLRDDFGSRYLSTSGAKDASGRAIRFKLYELFPDLSAAGVKVMHKIVHAPRKKWHMDATEIFYGTNQEYKAHVAIRNFLATYKDSGSFWGGTFAALFGEKYRKLGVGVGSLFSAGFAHTRMVGRYDTRGPVKPRRDNGAQIGRQNEE